MPLRARRLWWKTSTQPHLRHVVLPPPLPSLRLKMCLTCTRQHLRQRPAQLLRHQRQLLSHRAGAGDIFGPEFDRERERLRTHADYLALYGTRAPAHPPGSRYDEAERFFGQFKDLWLSLRPGNKVSMKEIRSVSGSHRPERFACLSLLDLWDDLLTFNQWLDNYATESSLSSPIVLMQRGLN